MIKDRKPLSMYEVEEIAKDIKDSDRIKDLKAFIKKFGELDAKKAIKLKEALTALDIIKLKEKDIIKIVDIFPENAAELNKVATEANLDAAEINKILDTIKNTK
jgi:DNA-directed RNA polymerase subunit F